MTDTTCDVLRACGRLRGSATFGHGGLAGLALGAALTVLSVGTADASYYYYYGHPSAYAPGSVYLPATPRPAAKKAPIASSVATVSRAAPRCSTSSRCR